MIPDEVKEIIDSLINMTEPCGSNVPERYQHQSKLLGYGKCTFTEYPDVIQHYYVPEQNEDGTWKFVEHHFKIPNPMNPKEKKRK